jgi:glycosyltransferase involved in cell wall biosynthesis
MSTRLDETTVSGGEDAALVSVVICFLDAEQFLEETIASVLSQSYGCWELLLVDDGSSDGSTSIAQHHAMRAPERIRYLEHPGHGNLGVSASRNLGIREARGELIAFLDADDVSLPHRLARSVWLLRENPAADMVYGESEYWHSWEGSRAAYADRIQPQGFRADRVVPPPELLIRYLTHSAALPPPSSITVRRGAAVASGGFVDSFRGMYEDQAFLARFCLYHPVYVAHECWDRYRQHAAGMCAEAARSGQVDQARRNYLDWLRDFLDTEGMKGTRVWDALRYAESVDRYPGRGWRAKFRRASLRAITRARMAMRSVHQA